MKSPAKWFKQNLWAVFLLHQLVIFITALAFLSAVRNITGRNIHLGQDPVGIFDGLALVALSAAVVVFTVVLYRRVKGSDAPPLGIALSPRRLLELLAGLLIGYALALLPWAIALLSGTAVITERLDMNYWAILILAAAFFLLFTQAVMEEITNRAFPMRLWAHRSFLFRIIVPSIFFAAIHLAGEQFAFERFGILFAAGIAQSLAYALTGNIWFTSGVHAGANYAIFSISGLWYAGALVNVAGQPAFPHWLTVMIILIFLSLIYGFRRRYKPLVVTNPADLSAR